MTSPAQHDSRRSAEETLRLIAGLPAPEGLADRVHARLRHAPRTAGLLHWPAAPLMGYRLHSPAFRAAAAAAIVCLVGGGGWQIYSRIPIAPASNAVVQPARVGNSGGFSNAGAMRTPDTLDRPQLPHAVPSAAPANTAPANALSPAQKPATPAKKHKAQENPTQTAPAQR